MSAVFYFASCQHGAENWLKHEMHALDPQLRPAFARPGFLTWKGKQSETYSGRESWDLRRQFSRAPVLATAWGVSLGLTRGWGGADVRLDSLYEQLSALASLRGENHQLLEPGAILHLWCRERTRRQEAQSAAPKAFHPLAVPGIVQALGLQTPLNARPRNDQLVIDLLLIDEEPLTLAWGVHRHSHLHSAFSGGWDSRPMPKRVVSRAYLKVRDLADYLDVPFRPEDQALEIGSAPGGTAQFLLERGLHVIGVDPAEMDAEILASSRFSHLKRRVNDITREELPERIDWILCDMNVESRIALFAVSRLALRCSSSLLGVLFTLKLNEWSRMADLPEMQQLVSAMGMVRVRATQRSFHRQEVALYGLTRLGLRRKVAATARTTDHG